MALHMLDLLVVERSTTGKVVTGTVEGELSEPLEDISQVATRLKLLLASGAAAAGAAPADPASARLLERILDDVTSIKRRMKDVASGPATILGAERSIAEAVLDPLLVGKRVLVADDDVRIRQIVRDVLQVRGAEVLICENGETAIAALAAASSVEGSAASPTDVGPGRERLVGGGGREGRAGRGFDLIVSDIKMPDKTGYQIFAEARRTMPGVPVILMTGFGYDPHHSIVRASQEGLSCVLFKPFQADRLVEEVHKAIAKK